jgi:iron complex outermembrane receptor protein
MALATPAMAQDVPPAAEDQAVAGGEEIVVQARRRGESVQDVPQVVNAVTSQELAKLNLKELKDVASVVPGLTLTPGANGIGGVATLRGVNFDVNASGNNGTVEFYLNDAPISAQIVLQSMFDIGQIEVLRGPQGTLRGRASPSGSITITTKKPDLNEFGGYIDSTVNNIGGVNMNGALNVPIIQGVLALRVAGLFDDNELNRVHSVNSPTIDPYSKTRSERVSLRFAPTDTIDIIGSYQHFNNHSQVFDQVESASYADRSITNPGPVAIAPGDRLAVEDFPRQFTEKYNIYNLQAEWRFSGLKLNYVGSWTDNDTVTRDPNDKGDYFTPAFGGNAVASNDPFSTGFATVPNLQNAAQFTDSESHQRSHELRLSSDERLFGMVDFVVGGLYNTLKPPFNLWSQTPLFLTVPESVAVLPGGNFTAQPTGFPMSIGFANSNIVQSQSTESKELSLFGNVTVHITDATEISGGLRYINYKNQSAKTIQVSPLAPPAPLGVAINEEFNPVIYSASIKHRFNDDFMVYASTGSSWRASAQTNGIIDRDDQFPSGVMLDLLHLPPETSKSYELGFKSTWWDKRATLNVSYYHQDFKNYFYSSRNVQIAQRIGNPDGIIGNADDVYQLVVANPALAANVPVKVDGIEADFSIEPARGLTFGGTVSYSKSKIKNGVIPCNIPGGAASAQELLAFTGGEQVNTCTVNYSAGNDAPFQFSLQGEYDRAINDQLDGFVRGLMNFKGDSENDPANSLDRVSMYAPVSFFAGVRSKDGWELTAFIKNAFNTQRVLTRDADPLAQNVVFLDATKVQSDPAHASLGGFPQVTPYRLITTTAPQEFGLNFRYSFGSR